MQIQDNDAVQINFDQSEAQALTPEIQKAGDLQSSQRVSVQSVSLSDTQKQAQQVWKTTEVLTPEILKSGGFEAAVLLLMQERDSLFKSTLNSRINRSHQNQDRLLEQTKERLEKMRDAVQEMDKAKKSGKIAETFGWVGLAASVVATALTAGMASPLVLASTVGTLALTTGLQIDGATGGHAIEGLTKLLTGSDSDKNKMIVSLSLSAALMAASLGTAAIVGLKGAGKGAELASKAGRVGAGANNANRGSSAARTAQTAQNQVAQGSVSNPANTLAGAQGSQGGAEAAASANVAGQAGGSTATNAANGASSAGRAGGAAGARARAAAEVPLGQGQPMGKWNQFFFKTILRESDPRIAMQKMNTGDHYLQQASTLANSALQVTGGVTSMRGAHARYDSTMFSVEAMKMRAIERRLLAHQEYLTQVLEDILGQIQTGNRTLSKQLSVAYDQNQAVLANI